LFHHEDAKKSFAILRVFRGEIFLVAAGLHRVHLWFHFLAVY